ncbi:6-phosphogluconate dehydrogenase C-terminal domain-like protein [Phanerochaete sordida]|uniref:6-phosphogluconate dehydrogenase C-terminal domain-like protein n=1 Tax=Phanerochaete sordida TaxID=48140 RepID=A0A9P3L8F0_9APHY|nr:6-phosphogluconate dehydrogenase C-terminal domain-like protein [Phanerochaete sordida]
MAQPVLAVVAAGAMGAAVGKRLTTAGLTVLTTLAGRSAATRKRAADAGLEDAALADIAARAHWTLSILPPSEAETFAKAFRDAHQQAAPTRPVGFADCNAVNPTTVKRIAALFKGTPIKFVDAGIIGGPPQGDYDPVFYASAAPEDTVELDEFASLKQWGLNVKALRGEGAGVGDASALKMSYAGITKGIIGICTTMVLSAHASSPATANALLHELSDSQPVILKRIIGSTPGMLPKAYRWVGEMEEISAFVADGLSHAESSSTQAQIEGAGEGLTHLGLARLYERVAKALTDTEEKGEDTAEVKVLKNFVKDAKEVVEPKK